MSKYGQAEYAYYLLKQITEKMLASGILTEQQFKIIDEKNKEDCFNIFSSTNAI